MGELRLRTVRGTNLFSVPVLLSLLNSPIQGCKAELLLATAASTLFLKQELMESLGGTPSDPHFNVVAGTGVTLLPTVADLRVSLGPAEERRTIRLLRVPVLPARGDGSESPDGVLGADVLHRINAKLSVDYSKKEGVLSWP